MKGEIRGIRVVAPAFSLPIAQEQAAALLGLQNQVAATMLQGTAPASLINLAAEVIRRADDLRAQLRESAPAESPVITGLQLFAQAARMYGFLLMRDLNPEQIWYWTEEWQAGERAADAQIAHGEGTVYANEDELAAAFAAVDAELDARANF